MIVQDAGNHVLLITQPDHAQLARRIMERWPPLAGSPRRDAILLAIGEHDAGWAETDAAPAVDPSTGAVIDFIHAPLAARQAWTPRSVARLAGTPWAAALVAQHGLTVYARNGSAPEWSAFFAGLAASRDACLRASDLPLETLLSDYVFLRVADLISLAFCTASTEAQAFGGTSIERRGNEVHVTPVDSPVSIPFTITARPIAKHPYSTDAELHAALAAATPVVLSGRVAG